MDESKYSRRKLQVGGGSLPAPYRPVLRVDNLTSEFESALFENSSRCVAFRERVRSNDPHTLIGGGELNKGLRGKTPERSPVICHGAARPPPR
jgi:hypothetical protein